MISVVVYDVATDSVERDKRVDYNDPSVRVWINKMFVWAFHNGKCVELCNAKDDEADPRQIDLFVPG